MRAFVFLLFLSTGMIGCQHQDGQDINTKVLNKNPNELTLSKAQLNNANIILGQIGQSPMSSILKVNGKIDVPPQNMVSISSPLGGYLTHTKLLPGMEVSKGEIIATIEDQQFIDLQQAYLTTKSKLHFAEKEYQRQKELNQEKATSDKQLLEAEKEYRNLQIEQSALKQKLSIINIDASKISTKSLSKSIHIYSPIHGFVSKVNVNIGRYVAPSEVLFELVNPSDIHLNLNIFEKDIQKLFLGQKLIAYTNMDITTKYKCNIILISKNISLDRSTEVHCHFDHYNKNLLPGMYMNAEIPIKINKSKILPEDAVVSFEGKQYIFIAKSTVHFILQEVEIGEANNGHIEIKNSDSLIGKSIVTQNAYTLLMALKNCEES